MSSHGQLIVLLGNHCLTAAFNKHCTGFGITGAFTFNIFSETFLHKIFKVIKEEKDGQEEMSLVRIKFSLIFEMIKSSLCLIL